MSDPTGEDSIEAYAIAWPTTAEPTAPEPDGDDGHLLPDAAWSDVVAGAEADQ